MQKPIGFEINKKEFEELTRDIYNNQYNNGFKIITNKRTYDLKNAKKTWMEVTTGKTTKSETKELYKELLQKDIDVLERGKIDESNKIVGIRKHILNIVRNIGSIFTDAYVHHKNVSKGTLLERSIAERTKIKRGRLDEIKRKQQKINNELFKVYFIDYQSPSNMYTNLSETKDEVNEVRVDSIKEILSKLQRIIDYTPKYNAFKIEENEEMIDILQRIFYFNQSNQSAQGLKILTPSQILSRLPIFLAQLKAGNNSEKLKCEIRQLLYSLYRSKILTKKIYKSLVKHGENLYEHWK